MQKTVDSAMVSSPVVDFSIHTNTTAEHVVVAVVGLGYVGLPTAVALRQAGHRIVGIDVSARRLDAIRRGEVELLSEECEALSRHLEGDGFVLTEQMQALDAADVVLVCVPTPIDQQLQPDPRILREACAAVVRHARPGQTLVLTSTTYVGTTRELLVQPLARRGLDVGEDVFVAFSPERIDPGVEGHEQLGTPRVMGGVTEACAERAEAVLAHTCKHVHRVSSPEAAEMVKLYENTFRAVNIALAFEMAEACQAYQLDPVEVTDGAATKPYGFLAHYPSAGVGGHCIGVDPYYLLGPLRERGRPALLAEEALRKVSGRPRHIAWRAHELLTRSGRPLKDARVLLVGASYKPGVADTREAPAVEIIERLRAEGAHVDYYDPLVPSLTIDGDTLHGVRVDLRGDGPNIGRGETVKVGSYDLAILATLHPGHDYGWIARCPAVLDCTYRTPGGKTRYLP
ncbi:MAG TPA: nucleotide sugar dehydrogenase [Solirubrobacteraceae bacterium]|jgi:nucleotide sugar dehydrogenase